MVIFILFLIALALFMVRCNTCPSKRIFTDLFFPRNIPIEERKVVIIDKIVHSRKKSEKSRIPKWIYQTNISGNVPLGMAKEIKRIQDMNPEYSYQFFDDQDVEDFIMEEYGERYYNCYKSSD